MIKTHAELITGFIGAGKTTWLNSFLKETVVKDEKLVVLQLETGEEQLKRLQIKADIHYLVKNEETLTAAYLHHLLTLYEPDRLIVECNGLQSMEQLTHLFSDAKVKKQAVITTIFDVIEAPMFSIYWENLKSVLLPSIKACHMLIITKCHQVNQNEKQTLQQALENENADAHILFVNDKRHMESEIQKCTLLDRGWQKAARLQIKMRFRKIQRLGRDPE